MFSAQNDHVNAFVTSNDGMATGVGQAIKGRHLEGKVYLSGLDADPSNLQLIAQGVQTMTVWTDLTEEGTTAVAGAVDLAKHQKFGFSTEMQDAGAGAVPTHLVKVSEVNKRISATSSPNSPHRAG